MWCGSDRGADIVMCALVNGCLEVTSENDIKVGVFLIVGSDEPVEVIF